MEVEVHLFEKSLCRYHELLVVKYILGTQRRLISGFQGPGSNPAASLSCLFVATMVQRLMKSIDLEIDIQSKSLYFKGGGESTSLVPLFSHT